MRTLARIVTLCLCLALPAAALADWPHLRGPSTDGRTGSAGSFPEGDVALEVAWRIPIGSGYSGIAVTGGRAVTMYAEDDSDWVAAFDAASGERVWRHRLGERTKGHDGSDDGPLATPTVGDGRVFALGADGTLHALALADGEVLWTSSLPGTFGSPPPYFGFTTTPLLTGGHVVVQAGGPEGKSIVALDPADGSVVWGAESGAVNYQSPVLLTAGGKEQIVAFDAERMVGVDPVDGAVLWSRPFGEDERAPGSPAVPMDGGRFLVRLAPGVAAFQVGKSDAGWIVEELYRNSVLGQGYSLPVYHDGHVYGYRGNILTCMDAGTGERVWRSRPPGGDGLIVVDGHLVVFGAQGNVVVAAASPEGYDEKARIAALGGSSLTWPSFADGRIFVRNLEEMAAVSVREGATGTAAASSGAAADHAFARFAAEVAGKDDAAYLIDAFLAQHPGGPVVDGSRVTFVYRGDAKEVAIAGSMLDSESAVSMDRVPGTDLFYRTFELEPGARFEYHFQPDFGDWVTDPRNPATVPAMEGDEMLSEYRSSAYGAAPAPLAEDAVRGTVETLTLASEALGAEKEVRVWLPPGYAAGEERYPLLVVHDGTAWIDKGGAIETLDRLVGTGAMRPVVAAFVPASQRWWLEAGGGQTVEYVAMVAKELIPALGEGYRLLPDAADRATLGNRFFAFSAAYVALSHPGSFGTVLMQSPYVGLGAEDDLFAKIAAKTAPETRFYLDWNRWDERNRDRGWDLGEDSRDLSNRLREAGYAIEGGEKMDSSGWGAWRSRLPGVLTATFPP